MGYTHYYGLTEKIKEIPAEAVQMIKETIEIHKDILRLDFDEDKPPVITNKEIQLNGYGDKGYETFCFSVNYLDYCCKTNEKDYDRTVSKILLILFHYIPEFKLNSDGFWIYKSQAEKFNKTGKVELNDYWNEALSYMKNRYSIEFNWKLKISKSNNHEYYCMEIKRNNKTLNSVDEKLPVDKEKCVKSTTKEAAKESKKTKSATNTKNSKYSKEDKNDYFKKQLEDLKNSIEDKIVDFIENSEELKKFIKFKKKHFKTYSFRNTMLIYDQFPRASYVAGFRKWGELGYNIKKGSKAIKILIPLFKKSDVSGEEKEVIYGFKRVNVFDVSQTEPGPNPQEIPSINFDVYSTAEMEYTEEEIFEATKTFITSQCTLNIVSDDSLAGALGMTNGKEIFVKDTGKPIDMSAVMFHEYAHYYNHFRENRKKLTKDLKETEAEITAMIFASYFNLNSENRFKYLALYRKERELDKCFQTAIETFEHIMSGVDGKDGLELILQRLGGGITHESKAS